MCRADVAWIRLSSKVCWPPKSSTSWTNVKQWMLWRLILVLSGFQARARWLLCTVSAHLSTLAVFWHLRIVRIPLYCSSLNNFISGHFFLSFELNRANDLGCFRAHPHVLLSSNRPDPWRTAGLFARASTRLDTINNHTHHPGLGKSQVAALGMFVCQSIVGEVIMRKEQQTENHFGWNLAKIVVIIKSLYAKVGDDRRHLSCEQMNGKMFVCARQSDF